MDLPESRAPPHRPGSPRESPELGPSARGSGKKQRSEEAAGLTREFDAESGP